MQLLDILIIIVILDIAGIIHIVTIKKNWLSFLAIPLSERYFGNNKTWRGLIVMSGVSGIIGWYFFGFFFSFLLGLLWILGELPNSFIKRKMGIPPGQQRRGVYSLLQYITDTLDSVLTIALFLFFAFDLSVTFVFLIILLGVINHALIDSICYWTSIKKMNFPNPGIIFSQLMVWIFFQTQQHFYKEKRKLHIDMKEHEMTIIIANHISKLDPFLLCTNMDWDTTKRLIPYRFMVSNGYMKRPIMRIFLKLVGGFPAYSYNEVGKNMSLSHSRTFLERGETLVIFPEGGIHHKKFGIGAFSLNQKVQASRLQLFRIEKKNKKYRIEFRGSETVQTYKDEDLLEISKKIFHKITSDETTH